MFDLTRHPHLLRALSYADRAKNFVLRKNAGKTAAQQHLAQFYRRVWHGAAAQVGATLEDLGGDVFEIRLGSQWTRVCNNCTTIDDLATHLIVRTKPVMYRLLAKHGLPVPDHIEFTIKEMQPAAAFLERAPRECVIKPACGTGGGLAVTTGVRTRWQLARAAWTASVHGDYPIIEEQVEGRNYRLLFLDGELIDAVKREPPTVIADGKSTVQQLVERLNQERLDHEGTLSHSLLTIDFDLQSTLRRQGLSFRSVPAEGKLVQLKTVINENSALDNVTAMNELCPALIEEAKQAVRISGLRLAGVDVITTNPGVSLHESGGVFLEVNSPPGYFWHYHKRDGAFPVAVHVLEAIFNRQPARREFVACPC
ncbi:MAG TPA: hypothetical protein VN688_14585 [Gemmataceae bacterium]|nr:hypothetical protein [Gemmataceae bacterium]